MRFNRCAFKRRRQALLRVERFPLGRVLPGFESCRATKHWKWVTKQHPLFGLGVLPERGLAFWRKRFLWGGSGFGPDDSELIKFRICVVPNTQSQLVRFQRRLDFDVSANQSSRTA